MLDPPSRYTSGWIKSCGTFLRLAVVRLDLNNMCRHKAFYEQIGA